MALMAFSDLEVYNDKTCTNTCLKSFETLKTQYDNLRVEFNKSEFNLATYKRGLASVEEQLVFYKKNEVMFYDQIAVLKRDTSFKDSEINTLKSEIEKLKKEKESNQIKIDKFENASKSLDKLIGSQISDNSRKGVGFVSYNVVPPPPTGLFAPPTIDLSNSGLEEFQQPEFEGYGPKASKSVCKDTSNEVKKTPNAPLGEKLMLEKEKKTVFPTKIESVKQQEKPARKPIKYAEMYKSQKPRGNQRNWNNLKSQQLGGDFVMYNKACFVCGSFDHVQAHCNYHQREGMVNGNNYTRVNYNYSAKKAHPNSHRNMTPRAVLMKTSLKPLNTARPVNTAHPKTTVYRARPMSCFSKLSQSTVKRPYQSRTTLTNKNFNQKINTAKPKAVNTAKPKAVNTARPTSAVVNAVRANQVNAVKASACWVWRPTKLNIHQQKEDQGYVDSGCSRHMTGNMSYLTDFKEFDKGYVTFGGGAKGGRITDVGDEVVHKELSDKIEKVATTASSLEVEQDSDAQTSHIKYALTENLTIYVSLIEQFWQTATTSTLEDGDMGITATIYGKVKVVSEASIRRYLKLEDSDGISTLSTAEIFEQLPLMGVRLYRVKDQQSQLSPITHPLVLHPPQNHQLHHHICQQPTLLKRLLQCPHDSPLPRVHSLGINECSLTLNELIVKKLEHKVKSIKARRKVRFVISDDEDDLEDPSKQGRKIAQIDEDEGITLVQMGAQTQGRSDEDLMYETGVYDYPEGFTGPSISITAVEPVTTASKGVSTARAIPEEVSTAKPDMDVTFAEALVDLLKSGKKKSPKPKARGISFQDPEEVARREVISPPVSKILTKDKRKAIMTEPEKLLKKKDQIQSDEELAPRLHTEEQAEFERLQKERVAQEEASRAAIYEEMDNIQAMIEAYIDTELVEGSEVRAEAEIAQESSSKRAGTELEQESIKKQKVDEDKEIAELQRLIEVVPDKEEVAIDAIPLATKPPSIVDWKIHRKGKKSYYQIIRADGSSKMYLVFSHMLKSFDREDLETLYKLVKAKYRSTRPVEDLDLVLYGDLKTMFEPHIEDNVWKINQTTEYWI
ncbi:hypothetical protein Tco_1383453 [Tanacetum coccineum]